MKPAAFLLLFLALATLGVAQTDAQRKAHYHYAGKVGIEGYDPVAYFGGGPKKGLATLTETYHGVTYRFATEANRAAFKADPAKYEPQYGGWCAYAMGLNGKKVDIDPTQYKIVDGKLYLFYNSSLWGNTLPKWNADEANLKPKADANWQKTLGS
ncbi:MAG: YHS domain-containing (seleno)protein [Bacteroidia bacterium]|nr:YHS domain-containing (seleno)protein [Bacteroidia bacterium]